MPRQPTSQQTKKVYWSAFGLFVILFLMYNLNFRHGSSVDTIPTTALPASLIREGNLDLDEFRTLLSTNTRALEGALIYFGGMQERNGHLLSSYPFGAAILATPFFWIADRFDYLQEWHHYRVVGKIAASFMVALAASFIFLSLRQSVASHAAWLIGLLFGLGTSAWSITSQELWQHGPGTLCLAIAVYALTRLGEDRTDETGTLSRRWTFVAGFFLGFAVLCRLLNAIPVLAFSAFIFFHHRKYVVHFFLPLTIIGIALAIYNVSTYGHLSGGYDAIYQSKWHAWRGLSSAGAYTNPLPIGLADVLASPSRGLLVYSPFLIPPFLALPLFVFRPRQILQRYLALWVLLMTLVLAKNTLWWGGASFGPRYFSETCVALAILLGGVWNTLMRSRISSSMFFAAGLISIFINGIGAFFAPCGWADEPASVDRHPERLWDWRDPEIARCAKFALQNGVKPPEILLYKSGDPDF